MLKNGQKKLNNFAMSLNMCSRHGWQRAGHIFVKVCPEKMSSKMVRNYVLSDGKDL